MNFSLPPPRASDTNLNAGATKRRLGSQRILEIALQKFEIFLRQSFKAMLPFPTDNCIFLPID